MADGICVSVVKGSQTKLLNFSSISLSKVKEATATLYFGKKGKDSVD